MPEADALHMKLHSLVYPYVDQKATSQSETGISQTLKTEIRSIEVCKSKRSRKTTLHGQHADKVAGAACWDYASEASQNL